ncbi:MAG: hypothetical protein RL172_2016 [Bacteroidota bacterium]|jgi:hypothetical protein
MFTRNTFIGALLLALLASPLLCMLVYHIKLAVHTHQAEERMERAQLVTITLPARQLIWVKKNKEILLQGKMFDVKTLHLQNDTAIITGIYDTAEDIIKARILALKKSNNNNSSSPIYPALVQLFSPAILTMHTSPGVPTFFLVKQYSPAVPLFYSNPSLSIPTPPPNT